MYLSVACLVLDIDQHRVYPRVSIQLRDKETIFKREKFAFKHKEKFSFVNLVLIYGNVQTNKRHLRGKINAESQLT